MYKNKISHLTQQNVIDQAPTELKPGRILYDLTGIKTQFNGILEIFTNQLNNIVEELKDIEEKNKNFLSFNNTKIKNKYIIALNEYCQIEENDLINFINTFDYNTVGEYNKIRDNLNLCRENFKKTQQPRAI